MVAVNQALQYPVGSSNEQLRAAVVRLIDVVRQGLGGDVSGDLAALQAELDALAASFTSLSGDVNTNLGVFEVDLASLQTAFASLVAEALTDQQLLEIAIDHARDDVQGSRAEFEAFMQQQHHDLLAAISRIRTAAHDNTSLLIDEQVARVTETEAIASTITGMVTDIANNTASVITESLARSTADDALAGQITTLTATVGANTAAITAEALTRATEDTALASQITTVAADVADNSAAISAEAIARADGDSALAATVSTVSTTVGSHTASISTINASIDGLRASWSVSVNVDGNVTGLVRLSGDNQSSYFTVLADSFLVARPDGTNATAMFGVGQVNGVTQVGINGNLIIDGSVLARHITVGSLDAITANLGTVTAGVIQSPGGETYWNLTTGEHRFAYYTDWIENLESQVTAADVALNAAVTDLLAAVGLVEADVAALQSGALTPQERFEIALDHAIDSVQGSRREFEVWVQNELIRVAQLALTTSRYTRDNTAAIVTEQVSRVSDTEAFASQVTAITADLASASAALVTEQIARADGDNALASSVATVEAGVASNTASITTINTVQSGIQSDVSALESDVTGITTDLGQVQAQWGVAINVNGQVVGLVQMDGSASGSQFAIVADKFVVAHPSTPGTTITPVVVGLVNGVSTIGLNGAVVVDGTILARHLAAGSVVAGTIAAGAVSAVNMNVGALSSITANMGTVTAGLIQSNDGLSYWNLSTGEFVIGAPA